MTNIIINIKINFFMLQYMIFVKSKISWTGSKISWTPSKSSWTGGPRFLGQGSKISWMGSKKSWHWRLPTFLHGVQKEKFNPTAVKMICFVNVTITFPHTNSINLDPTKTFSSYSGGAIVTLAPPW